MDFPYELKIEYSLIADDWNQQLNANDLLLYNYI